MFATGLIVTLFGAYMVIWEKRLSKIDGEIWKMFFGGRYIILLMGLFSMYTGAIYNDVFSKSVNIFGSKWTVGSVYNDTTLRNNSMLILDPKEAYVDEPYIFGMDPVWQMAKNKINFFNTFKMKLSIIFGVAHMIFGVSMSVVNFV